MAKRTVAFACVFVILWCIETTFVQSMRADNPNSASSEEFNRLVDDYFEAYFQFHPKEATAAGLHQHDTKLEDYSRTAREAEAAKLRALASRLDQINPARLSSESAGDLAFLKRSLKGRLLELETLQMWRKDPNLCTSGVTESIFLIIKRNFAPPEERLRLVIARERQIPDALITARRNLQNPPKIYTQIALEQMPGIIAFFRKDVPSAFQDVKDATLQAEFNRSNAAAVSAFEKFQLFLRDDLLPTSQGDFRIGAENFREKLLDEEMVDIPLDQLLQVGYADLRRNQQRLKETAAMINPHASPHEVLATLEKNHPAPDKLLETFRDLLGSLRQFIEANRVITIPSPILPILEESPPFMRATTTASMDTPGPYETQATEAMFNVTLPEPDWTPQHVEEWMESFNRGTILSTAIHEAYPGHYTQFLWAKRFPSKVRKLLYCGTNVEGWAHYTEQMMLDEGFGGGDPKLRMGQLQDALLRDARFIVGIEIHTGHMTLDQAREFFIREGYQVPAVADVEAKRGTADPTYLVYTLGKLQILKLREDYKKKLGAHFTLQGFHDHFMEQGGVPLPIIRKALLGDDSPTL
ncbi:MAG: DUF885 domain-containing protein [Terriglobia bacterium]|jgi:uncharacterized protein (DUF885 family)